MHIVQMNSIHKISRYPDSLSLDFLVLQLYFTLHEILNRCRSHNPIENCKNTVFNSQRYKNFETRNIFKPVKKFAC